MRVCQFRHPGRMEGEDDTFGPGRGQAGLFNRP